MKSPSKVTEYDVNNNNTMLIQKEKRLVGQPKATPSALIEF